MNISNRAEPLLLFAGDFLLFFFSLWVTLVIRYGELPDRVVLVQHLWPFAIFFVLWTTVFFIAGLYEHHTLLLQKRLPRLLFNALIAEGILAVLFFYFIPNLVIAPKVNLFIFLFVSFSLIFLWRWYSHIFFGISEKQNAIMVGSGEEMQELEKEINHNSRYPLKFVLSVDVNRLSGMDIEAEIMRHVYAENISLAVIDFKSDKVDPLLPHLYSLLFSRVSFVDMYKLYESIFGRIPLSLVQYHWFLEHVSASSRRSYDILKRMMDIVIALPLLLVPILAYPFVLLGVKSEDGGPVFGVQRRVGKNNQLIRLLKFRTMAFNDDGDWKGLGQKNKVTRVGAFLRRIRLDEFPQLWNVLKGDLSLIGPRPEFPEPVGHYVKEIPYYNIRHLITPGLSGWAQIYHENHPHHKTDFSETKIKLSYGLYYIKNRSFFLDLKIALKTIKILLSRSGV